METFEVKILSYIRNFRKIIFICPICRENNSCVIADEAVLSSTFKCDGCRKSYTADFSQLKNILISMGVK
jgi:transposase-like protein